MFPDSIAQDLAANYAIVPIFTKQYPSTGVLLAATPDVTIVEPGHLHLRREPGRSATR